MTAAPNWWPADYVDEVMPEGRETPTRGLCVRLKRDVLRLELHLPRPGEFDITAAIDVTDFSGETPQIGFNISYLSEIFRCGAEHLRPGSSDGATLEIGDAASPINIRFPFLEDSAFILMPMRIG